MIRALPSLIDIKMVTAEIVVATVSAAATATLIALRKSKCFVRKLRSGLEYGIGFTERPIIVNELPLQSQDIPDD